MTEYVWARTAPGLSKRVKREVAEAEGWEFEVPKESGPIEAPVSNTYRLSPGERERIYLQTGVRVEDYAHYKRVQRERGWRDVEKGEPGDIVRKEVVEWVDAGAKGECPAGRNSVGEAPRRRVDMRELRYKVRNGLV